MNRQKSNNDKKKFDDFVKYSGLGFEMAAIIAIGTFGGYKIDQWLHNQFKGFTLFLMIISVIISILYGVRNLLKK
jgi:Putative F0F1-ATPase subunit Ca2+/Mg2+ transporter